jgi:hypothetical protein
MIKKLTLGQGEIVFPCLRTTPLIFSQHHGFQKTVTRWGECHEIPYIIADPVVTVGRTGLRR